MISCLSLPKSFKMEGAPFEFGDSSGLAVSAQTSQNSQPGGLQADGTTGTNLAASGNVISQRTSQE